MFDLAFIVQLENICMGRKHGRVETVEFSQLEQCFCRAERHTEDTLTFVNGVVFNAGRC